MKIFPNHPVIDEVERYGYIRENEDIEPDYDRAYEEQREAEMFGADDD